MPEYLTSLTHTNGIRIAKDHVSFQNQGGGWRQGREVGLAGVGWRDGEKMQTTVIE